LTRELLATARAESPTRSHEAIDLASTASEATDRFRSCAAMQGATIESDVESTRVLADAEAIDRLVSVLVENALKHGKAEGTVRVVVRRREGAGELTVEDDGPGFSPEALRFGAERFWRGTGVRVPGAGLGLSIAAAIARSCGGSLSLGNSTRGAVVRMRLPLAK
jgi:signal transduction histidine kinase